MREVREHPEAVHLAHQLFAEIGEPEVLAAIRRRVRPVDVVPVREREITRAERVEHAQRGRRILDHVAALDTHEAGDPAAAANALDVVGGARLLEILVRG